MYKKWTINGHFGNSSQSVLFACSSNTLPKHPYFRVLNCPIKPPIHTVGPVWYGGNKNEREMLKSCYKTTLELTKKFDIKTIAFPAISCGIYRFPLDEASKIAINTIKEYLQHNNNLDKVILIDINDEIVEKYKKINYNYRLFNRSERYCL